MLTIELHSIDIIYPDLVVVLQIPHFCKEIKKIYQHAVSIFAVKFEGLDIESLLYLYFDLTRQKLEMPLV